MARAQLHAELVALVAALAEEAREDERLLLAARRARLHDELEQRKDQQALARADRDHAGEGQDALRLVAEDV